MKRTGAEPREKDIRNLQNLHESSASIQAWRIGCHTCIPCGDSVHRWIVFTPAVCVPHSTRTPPSYLFIPFHSMFSSFIYSFFPALLMLSSFAPHDPPFFCKWSFSAPFTLPGPAGPWSAEHRQPISIATHGWTPSTKEQRGRPARTRLPIAHSEGVGR